MQNKKKLIGLIAGLVCVVLCVVALFTQCGGNNTVPTTASTSAPGQTETTAPAPETTAPVTETTEPEETTEPTETTAPPTETTEPTETTASSGSSRPGGSNGGSNGGSGNSVSTTQPTEETTEPTETTEAPTFPEAGARENPYTESAAGVPTEITTVQIPANGAVFYHLYNVKNTVITIDDGNAYIIYNGTRYKAKGGVVTLELGEDTAEPVILKIGNNSKKAKTFTLCVNEHVGGMTNPEILKNVDQITTILAAGDADGYSYRWTAGANGTLTFLADNETCEVMVSVNGKPVEPNTEGVLAAQVAAGDVVDIHVTAVAAEDGAYPDAQVTITTTFEAEVVDVPTEPSEESTEPSEESTEPSEEPTEPSEEPTEPSEEPTEPSEEPTEPSEEPTEPSEEPTEPSEEPTEPSEEPTEPSEEPTEPSEEPTEPSEEPTEPSEEPTEPSEEPTEPSEEPTEPTEPTAPAEPAAVYELADGDKVAATIPVGGFIHVVVDATDSNMTLLVNGNRMYYEWYILVDGQELTPYNSGSRDVELAAGSVYTLAVYNSSEENDQTVDLTASAPKTGTMDNPQVLEELGTVTASIEAGSEGYYYTWTAQEDGILTVIMRSESGWQFFVNNETAGVYGDVRLFSDENPQASENVKVTAGDVIRIMVSTYDPNNWFMAPAGEISAELKFVAGDGTDDAPYMMTLYDVPAYDPLMSGMTIKIGAGESVRYDLYFFMGKTVTITGEGAYVIYNGKTYTAQNGVVTVDISDRIALVQIGNSGDGAVAFAVDYLVVLGSMDTPEILTELGTITATVEAGSQGYYYNWIAEADGTLTVTMLNDGGWQYHLNNYGSYIYGNNHWSSDETPVPTDEIEVRAGDTVEIWVSTYDPKSPFTVPGGEVKFEAVFTPAE